MSHLPIDTCRPRRISSKLGAFALLTPLRVALLLLLSTCVATASAQATFTVTNNSPITLPSNTFASLTVTVTPVGGFTGSVLLTCTNMPIYASCKFPELDQVLPVSGSAASVTLIVNTSQVDQYETRSAPRSSKMKSVALCTLFAPAFGLLLFARRKGASRAGLARLMMCAVVLLPLSGLAGCAAVHPLSTPAGTYTFLINGNAGAQNIPTTVTLKVT